MPRVIKLNGMNVLTWTPHEADRRPNINLGRNGRIITNNLLKKNVRLHSYVNNDTMGALDNYAEHEKLQIYITPYEDDLFHDLKVSVLKSGSNTTMEKEFPIKIHEGREGVTKFFRELYTKVANAVKGMNKPDVQPLK